MYAPAVLGLALCAGDEEISCRPSSRVHLTIVRTAGEQDVQGTGSLDRLFVLSRGDQRSQATTQTRPASVLGGCDGFLLVRPGSCGVRGPGDHLIRVALYSHGFTVRGFPTPSAVGGHSSCSHSITSRVVSTSGPTVDVSRETSTLRSRFIVAPPGVRPWFPTPAGTGTRAPTCVGPGAATGTGGQTFTPSSEGRSPGREHGHRHVLGDGRSDSDADGPPCHGDPEATVPSTPPTTPTRATDAQSTGNTGREQTETGAVNVSRETLSARHDLGRFQVMHSGSCPPGRQCDPHEQEFRHSRLPGVG